jgi:hypothetical protein
MRTKVRCVAFSTMTLPAIMTIPPQPPPLDLFTNGSECCFRATCLITSSQKITDSARVVGYHTTPRIANDTERACKIMANQNRSWKCSPATLVMLPGSDTLCSGQVYFYMGPKTKRLV